MGWVGGAFSTGAAFSPNQIRILSSPLPLEKSQEDNHRVPRTERIEKYHSWAKTSDIILLSLIEKNFLDVCIFKK